MAEIPEVKIAEDLKNAHTLAELALATVCEWHGKNQTDDAVAEDTDLHEKITPGHSAWQTHGISPIAFAVVGKGWPGNLGRREASQATTSETSCDDIGLPGTSLRQSGAPSSGRPAITIVLSS